MTGTVLLQSYEDSRGFTRNLPDADVLTLISRLVTEHLVRKDGSEEAAIAIGRAVGVGMDIGRDVLRAQHEALSVDAISSS